MERNTISLEAKDHPGVYIPPPLLYVATFFLSVFIQSILPIDHSLFSTRGGNTIGWIFIALHLLFMVPAFWRFLISKNSLIPIKPARSLQTSGIYSVTRNPMYLALLLLYFGMAIFKGNWWTYLLAPLVVWIVESYVIRKEEQYLRRTFREEFDNYCKKVRRWI